MRSAFLSLCVVLGLMTTAVAGEREALSKAQARKRARSLAKVGRLLKADKPKRALRVAEALASDHPKDAEVGFYLALTRIVRGDRDGAGSAMRAMADSGDPLAPKWIVKARRDKRFDPLRGSPDYRYATGLSKERAATLYERLLGSGGVWEQTSKPCESPEVRLTLSDDKKARFELRVENRCDGQVQKSRFRGFWRVKEQTLTLVFPNPGGDDETLPCAPEACADEQCVRCGKGTELEFLALPALR